MTKEKDSLENKMILKLLYHLYNKTILIQNLSKLSRSMFLDSHSGRE